jgi:hypothetical protein
MKAASSSGLKSWQGDELFQVSKRSEAACDHLHTLMVFENLGNLGELKVFDYVLSHSYNSKLNINFS